jgi:hypothetical protein
MSLLDRLDREFSERGFDAARAEVKDNNGSAELDSDEGLEAALRRELIEIACLNFESDPEILRDPVLARIAPLKRPIPSAVRTLGRRQLLTSDTCRQAQKNCG